MDDFAAMVLDIGTLRSFMLTVLSRIYSDSSLPYHFPRTAEFVLDCPRRDTGVLGVQLIPPLLFRLW